MEFKRKTVELTPELASEYLSRRHPTLQRKYDANYAEQLSRDISAGRWNNDLHGADPMIFSDSGYLINAQHRCGAVVIANKPIVIDVLYGVPEEMFEYVDAGKARSVAQFVHTKHSNTVTALARFANSIECGNTITTALTGRVVHTRSNGKKRSVSAGRVEVLSYIHDNASELEYIASQADRIYYAMRGGSKASFAAALWVILYVSKDQGIGEVLNLIDDIAADVPRSPIVAHGKVIGMSKLITAARQGMKINSDYWVGLILTMYRLSSTNRLKVTQKDINDAIPYYNLLIKRKQGFKELDN